VLPVFATHQQYDKKFSSNLPFTNFQVPFLGRADEDPVEDQADPKVSERRQPKVGDYGDEELELHVLVLVSRQRSSPSVCVS